MWEVIAQLRRELSAPGDEQTAQSCFRTKCFFHFMVMATRSEKDASPRESPPGSAPLPQL